VPSKGGVTHASRVDLAPYRALALELARESGALITRLYGQPGLAVETKADASPVTAADRGAEELMRTLIAKAFPGHGIIGEEFGEERPDAEFTWVLDPIDGTNNFALGIACCAISLALLKDGEPVYGVVYDLSRRTLMHGGPGFGAFDGDKPLAVSRAPVSKETLIGFHSPSDKTLVPMAAGVIGEFKIRGLGTATMHLAYVAAGIFDGCVDYNVKIWDLAAAIPLVRAAGGEVQFLNGEQLPIRTFDLKMKKIVYVAGHAQMCTRLRAAMRV